MRWAYQVGQDGPCRRRTTIAARALVGVATANSTSHHRPVMSSAARPTAVSATATRAQR